MGLYVEVMCDVRREWPDDGQYYGLFHRCASHRGDNPQGHSVASAKAAARKAKWLINRDFACCPGCRKKMFDGEVEIP